MNREFWVRPAAEVSGVRQVASLDQPAVGNKRNQHIHVQEGDEALRARWEGYLDQAALWQAPGAITVFELHNAFILGRSCLVMTEDGVVLRESIQKTSKLNELRPHFDTPEVDLGRVMTGAARPQFSTPEPPFLRGAHSIFTPALVDNFYHWTVETLPRLALEELFAPGVTPVAPPLRKPFQASSLEAMGRPLSGFLQNDRVIQVQKLVFASPLARSNVAFAPMVRGFFEAYGRGLGARGGGRRLYISREKTRMRRVTNENEIFAIAAQFGFEKLTLEDLSFAEQARLFAEAEVIVGPHGAGFGNAVHCRPGATLVELLHDEFREGMTSFCALANMFGLGYHLVLGTADKDSARVPANSDFAVEPALFSRALARAMRDG